MKDYYTNTVDGAAYFERNRSMDADDWDAPSPFEDEEENACRFCGHALTSEDHENGYCSSCEEEI